MLDQIFGQLFSSQWIVFTVLLILLVGLSELGVAHGLSVQPEKVESGQGHGTVRSAVLALLGLLLGFSFALAGARHETRRELLVEEANSIVTTARRAQLLSEPHAANVAQLLREYVPLRIEVHREAQSSDQFATTRKRSADLQDRMWAEAVAAAAERPSPITASFITSLNQTIDLEATRIAAKRNTCPVLSGSFYYAWLVAACGSSVIRRELPASLDLERFVFPILIAIVIAIIRHRYSARGLISLDERPLLELDETLRGSSTSTTP